MKKIGLLLIGLSTIISCQKNNEDKNAINQFGEICDFKTEILSPEGFQVETIGTMDFNGSMQAFQFVNDNVGYVMASKNVGGYVGVLKTVDGGQSWTDLNINISQSPVNMVFKDENFGLISVHDVTGCPPPSCQNKCVILKTENGGENWKEVEFEELKGVLYHLKFDEEGKLFANLKLNDQTTLMKSEDNGESWDTLFSSSELDFALVTFSFELFEDKIFISGEAGKIVVIDKNGNLEKTIETNKTGIWDLKVIDENNLIVVVSGEVMKSIDGGESWEVIYEESARMIDFESVDKGLLLLKKSSCPTDVYQVNDLIASTKDGGLNWVEAEETTTNLRINYSNSQKMDTGKYFILIGNKLVQIKEN